MKWLDKYDLDEVLSNEMLLKQTFAETAFKPAKSSAGARGLTQFTPITIKELKRLKLVGDDFDIDDNASAVDAHKKYMNHLISSSWVGGDKNTREVKLAKALAGYNRGPGAVKRLLKQQEAKGIDVYKSLDWVKALPKETRDYIDMILLDKNTEGRPHFQKNFKKAVRDEKYKDILKYYNYTLEEDDDVNNDSAVQEITSEQGLPPVKGNNPIDLDSFNYFNNPNVPSEQEMQGVQDYIGEMKKARDGGIIEDDRGQWAHPGKVTKIDSNNITMQGVNYPVLGISDTGDQKLMMPGQDYKFQGNSVTEYPIKAQKGKKLKRTYPTDERAQAFKTRDAIPDQKEYNLKKLSPEYIAELKRQELIAQQGELRTHKPQGFFNKVVDVATNPLTAAGYIVRNERIPDNFTAGPRNNLDYALDVINPAQYALDTKNLVEGTVTGNLSQMGEGALGLLPLGTETKAIKNAYNNTRGTIRSAIEVGDLKPASLYHNYVRQPIKNDRTSTAMFKTTYSDLPPKEQNAAIAAEVDAIMNNLPAGGQFREKSLSADSFRLLTHKGSAKSKEFRAIPTGAYQRLNGMSDLRKHLKSKHLRANEEIINKALATVGDNYEEAEEIFRYFNDNYDKLVNEDIIKKLTPYTERLSRQTGKKILPPKIIGDNVHIPQIIFEKNGKSIGTELQRHKTALLFGTMGAGAVSLPFAVDMANNASSSSQKEPQDDSQQQISLDDNSGDPKKVQQDGQIPMMQWGGILASNNWLDKYE